MNTTNCPLCGKPNPDTVDICQYCGTVLKRSATVPLPPIRPGDMPVKRKTSDLESTLPGWLRDVRRASNEADNTPESKPDEAPKPAEPVAPPPEKPAPPKQKESASPLDFLAGLAQANDEEEDVPDWLKSLQSSMPAAQEPAPTPEPSSEKPADRVSDLQSETQDNPPPAASEPDWGFGNQPATFNFDQNVDAAAPASQETPDWLSALKAQADETTRPASSETPPPSQAAGGQPPSDETPDWLAALSDTGIGTVPVQPESRPVESQPASSDDAPDWLSSLGGRGNSQPEQPPAANVPAAETPDWLSSLGESSNTQPEQIPTTKPSTEEMPDWLSALSDTGTGTASSQPESKPAEKQPASSGETPDWLASLGESDEAQPEQVPATEVPAAETPDWLSALSDTGAGEVPSQPESKPAEKQPASSGETPDWLASLGESGEVQPEQIPTANAPAVEAPDWLSALSDMGIGTAPSQPESKPVELQPASSGETPDWLTSLGASSEAPSEQIPATNVPAAETPDWLSALSDMSTETAPSQPESKPVEKQPAQGDDTLDWLSSLGASSEAPAEQIPAINAPAAETPDWLSSLGGEFNAEETPASREANEQPIADTSDWLANLGGEPSIPREPVTAESVTSESLSATDLPPWLSGLTGASLPAESKAAQPASEKEIPPVEPQLVASDIPDWMAALQGPSIPEAEVPAAQEPGIVEFPASMDIPDWMAGLSVEHAESQPTGIPEPASTGESELPSWLADAMGEKPVEKPASPSKPFDTGALRELGSLAAAEEVPDWMANIGGPSPTPKPSEVHEEIVPEKPVVPDTVSPVQPAPTAFEAAPANAKTPVSPVFGEEQNLESILSLDMPDWLSGFTPTEAELSESASTEKTAEDNIRPADLPSWVQAMRPVEDVMGEKIDEEEDQQVESSGPLAGLRSVLPSQPGLPELHKPKSYSIKLQVDETQKAQAALLENILNSESKPLAALPQSEALVIRPLRWVIAGVLLVTVLLGALLQDMVGSPVFPSPDMSAGHSQISTFKETIDNLSDNATVLVVVDYQPGFAGEMESAAGPVIGQLMGKNTRLAFISTSPVGSYMADRLLQKFTEKYPYELGTQYVNLGYLPGGAGGIQVFAELPGTTVGRDWFLGNLWEKDALKNVTIENVTKLSNFSAVVVLTDNPDTGRLWIEQAEPALKPKPMLMVVSAQAEPMIRPYLASGQLKGMVSGLEDGALYESLLANPGQARSYWDAFGVAVIAAELLIIVGGVWVLVTGSRARRAKKTEQDEA